MRIAAEIIHTVGETEASFGGVQLVRDNRLDVRRTGHPPGGRTPPGHPLVPSIFPMPRQTQSCKARSPLGTGTHSPFQAEPVQMPDGPWRWTALALAVAPLAAHARSKYFPACSEAPAKMRGMRVEEVGAGVLGKALMAPFLLSAASQLSAGHRDEAELSHFHRLDENPHAVAAFLKWVGGGSAAWYQHQGVRRLREICKAGAALHGRSGR